MVRFKIGGAVVGAALTATACGTASMALIHPAAHTLRQSATIRSVAPSTTPDLETPVAPSAHAPTSAATSPPTPPPAPQHIAVLTATPHQAIVILDAAGRAVASTPVNLIAGWATAVGPGGAYWISGQQVHELTLSGAVRTVGTVPAGTDQMLVSPDGMEYAYATTQAVHPGSGVTENRIYAQPFGAAAHVIADRVSDPTHPTTDAPASWDYYLMSWTSNGILFARMPLGGCGCGPFDMEMQSADTALIDPSNSTTTEVTQDGSCPLAAYASSGGSACFQN
ncbi:MAG TPA: hypothetical protein VFA70_04955, partial [Dehalococcoidia bacterium]|nr:hypothetical protein [Dehalococcoidia bacterium]